MKAAMATCMPRLVRGGGGCRASTARPAGSVSLLERIREVVLRLIMFSAVSRASTTQRTSTSGKSPKDSSPAGDAASRHSESHARVAVAVAAAACRRDDSIRNEAVEDCIEFLKRSSAEGDSAKLTTADPKLTDEGGEDKEPWAAFFILNVEARGEVASPSCGCRESV